jgi:hypothetical protein
LVWLASTLDSFRRPTARVLVLVVTAGKRGRVLGSAVVPTLELLYSTLRRSPGGDGITTRCRGWSRRGLLEGNCCHDGITPVWVVVVVLDDIVVLEIVEDKTVYLDEYERWAMERRGVEGAAQTSSMMAGDSDTLPRAAESI